MAAGRGRGRGSGGGGRGGGGTAGGGKVRERSQRIVVKCFVPDARYIAHIYSLYHAYRVTPQGPQISFTKHVPKFLQAHSKMLAGSEEQHELMDAAEAHTAKRAREGEDSEEEEMRERHEAMQGTCHEHPEMREHILAEIAKVHAFVTLRWCLP